MKNCYFNGKIRKYGNIVSFLAIMASGCSSLPPLNKKINYSIAKEDPHLNIGVQVYDLSNKKMIINRHGKRLYTPASTIKLLTAMAALTQLGSDFKFTTQVYQDKKHDIYIRLNGDPELTSEHLYEITSKLNREYPRLHNIYFVHQNIQLPDLSPGLMLEDIGYCYAAPVGSYILDRNCKSSVKQEHRDQPIIAIKDYMIQTFQKINKKHFSKKYKHIKFKSLPVSSKLLFEFKSSTLYALLYKAMKDSDNLIMDAIFLKLTEPARFLSAKDSWENRGQYLLGMLSQAYEVDLKTAVMVDGSGLSRYNLIQAQQMTDLLVAIHKNNKAYFKFISLLPIAGLDGTLKNRKIGNINALMRAKTGSLNGTLNLVGYLENKEGKMFSFVIMMNQFSGENKRYINLQEKICSHLITNLSKKAQNLLIHGGDVSP